MTNPISECLQIAVSTASSSSNPSTAELEDVAASPAMAGSSTAHIKRNNAVKAFFRCAAGTPVDLGSRVSVSCQSIPYLMNMGFSSIFTFSD